MATSAFEDVVSWGFDRFLAETAHDDDVMHDDGHGHSEFGVHITYEDLYDAVVFLSCIYVAGEVSSRIFKMPNLVGEIVAGILLGPPLADFVPNAEAWVLLGELGLVILVIEAGIDIDVGTLQLIGTRGFLVAVVGSILPIGLGIGIAILLGFTDMKEAIAAGATFGPTSLGIALNILRGGGVLNTPVGQMIISAAVIDDMIALIVLSQLEALTGTIDVVTVLTPVVSAVLFLVVGGYIAIFILPGLLDKFLFPNMNEKSRDKAELALMMGLLIGLMPATYYGKASYLMGAFISGLGFCTSHELHSIFVRQFKRVLQWLMRIFFAASIGFQVPVKDFGNLTVIWQGCVFALALLGKLAVGFMVPNFTQSPSFTNFHLRDCLITGLSMAAEGEFAFVIAVFSVDNGLIDKELYASVVLAVLFSTIVPPFLLRSVITYYNKKAEQMLEQAAKDEMEMNHSLVLQDDLENAENRENKLKQQILNRSAVFLCIQTHSDAKWGLMNILMSSLAKLGLDIIDHRAWAPRGVNTTVVNEIYAKDRLDLDRNDKDHAQQVLEERMKEIGDALKKAMDQGDSCNVKVQRWYPGVVEEIVESVHESNRVETRSTINLEQRLLEAANKELERKQSLAENATTKKSVDKILSEMGSSAKALDIPAERGKRRRQKMRSTPVVGGGLFGETSGGGDEFDIHQSNMPEAPTEASAFPPRKPKEKKAGHAAELIVEGETFKIRVSDEMLRSLRIGSSGFAKRGELSLGDGLMIDDASVPVVNRLRGYVRNANTLGMITEGDGEDSSEHNSDSKA